MADALASGASVRKDVGVQVPPRPQNLFDATVFVVENSLAPTICDQFELFWR